jgi:hypothetical protein
VVRRPPPILSSSPRGRPSPALVAFGIPLVAFVYFLAAPWLPALPAGDTTVLVAGGIGLLMVAATTLSQLPARDTVTGPVLIVVGAGLIAGALNAGGVGAGANVPEALLAAAVGLLFARWLSAPAVAIVVPVFVGAIDIWSVASGPTSRLLESGPESSDALSFDLPAWGHMGSTGQLGVSDAVFLSMFAAWAMHVGFRRTATIIGLILGLITSLVLSIVLDRAIPALPLIAVGYLLPNIDRVGRLLRHQPEGPSRG